MTDQKMCERCDTVAANKGERYCKNCRKLVIAELKQAGYLKHPGGRPSSRSGKTEDINATKRGDENPWQSNAVKAMEGD